MKANRFGIIPSLLVLLFLFALPLTARAQWRATVGAENTDMGHQALAFLPNEIWIHAGDTITWTWQTHEIHTLTFLTPGQVRPPFAVGCPGFSFGPATFDGSACVSTPPMVKGQTFAVTFPKAGNYKLVCLVHADMSGVIHVLEAGVTLPHDQAFYDAEAAAQSAALLSDTDIGQAEGQQTDRSGDDALVAEVLPHVTAGVGEVTASAGGKRTLSIVRFFGSTITIRASDTIEWTNHDPVTPHTITFGAEPLNPVPPSCNPSCNFSVDPDGARHATITSPADNVHSGIIVAAPQERVGLPLSPPGVTRFRVTFTQPGIYPYRCVLHDNLGMVGTVTVLP